jgi:hypothetical protein
MKAENIQSNTSAPRIAGSQFARFEQEQDGLLVDKLLTHAKGIHTKQDVEEFLTGYVEGLSGDANSKKVRKSMVRKILVVLTATDKKLNEYHKLSKPADGQKLVRSKMKVAKGINALSAALRVPSAPKVEGEGESESEAGFVNKADAWWAACIKLGHSDKYGLTTDEMMARIAEIVASD